jgi:hypothetical protein
MFGWRPELADAHVEALTQNLAAQGIPVRFQDQAPHLMQGADPTKPAILHDVAKKVTGDFLRSQNQPRGTCTSRGAKRAVDLTQCVLIAAGEPYEFKYTSHAVLYGLGREHAGMLGGNPNNENDDGCSGAAMAWAANQGGNLANDEDQDDDNKDDMACLWGARGCPSEIKTKAAQRLIKAVALVRTPEETRDALVSGHAVTVASNVGFEGIPAQHVFGRDQDGRAHRRGTWNHQMCFTGYRPDKQWFLVDQSWGPSSPDGPIGDLPIPSYSFWAAWDDAAAMIRQGDSWAFSGFVGWPNLNRVFSWANL